MSIFAHTPETGNWPWTETEEIGAIDIVQKTINAIEMPAAIALDVGLIKGRGWAVVEANSAWGSGIYGCDPSKMLLKEASFISHAQ